MCYGSANSASLLRAGQSFNSFAQVGYDVHARFIYCHHARFKFIYLRGVWLKHYPKYDSYASFNPCDRVGRDGNSAVPFLLNFVSIQAPVWGAMWCCPRIIAENHQKCPSMLHFLSHCLRKVVNLRNRIPLICTSMSPAYLEELELCPTHKCMAFYSCFFDHADFTSSLYSAMVVFFLTQLDLIFLCVFIFYIF